MKLFGGNKYNDEQLVNQSMTAIANDPLISDPGALVVTSKNGVVTMSGVVRSQPEKERIEDVVRNALTTMGLKHEQIVNELRLPQTVG
jgi:osmotically-inducible protein OsmY